jgi:hypothetical protein
LLGALADNLAEPIITQLKHIITSTTCEITKSSEHLAGLNRQSYTINTQQHISALSSQSDLRLTSCLKRLS